MTRDDLKKLEIRIRREENEACAKVVESLKKPITRNYDDFKYDWEGGFTSSLDDAARAIRERMEHGK